MLTDDGLVSAMPPAPPAPPTPLRRGDWVILTLAGVLLFGYCAFSGKPLTMHEARLPQTAREMLQTGEWLLPHSGDRPWLERPPLPHWTLIVIGHLTGGLDEVWKTRLPAAMAGTATLLLIGWIGARLLGRDVGMLAAISLATMYEFYFYAGQSEDDIFLALLTTACFALFVAGTASANSGKPERFVGNRSWPVWGFFVVLGISSLAKGPLVGASQVLAATAAFTLLSRDRILIRRYLWLWGWLAMLALTIAWGLYAWWVYPSVWDNWKYDYTGPFGKQPAWYYLAALMWTIAPWTPLALAGLWITRDRAVHRGTSPQRFIWCWTLIPLVLISIPARKHHHYLLPSLPGWSLLAGIGLARLGEWLKSRPKTRHGLAWNLAVVGLPVMVFLTFGAVTGKIPGPAVYPIMLGVVFVACIAGVTLGIEYRRGAWAMGAVFVGFCCFAAWGQSVLGTRDERRSTDLEFITQVGRIVPTDEPLFIVADDTLDFFRFQFYSRPSARVLQNMTFLLDEKITAPRVHVIARADDAPYIADALGNFTVEATSPRTRAAKKPGDIWTLYRIDFKPDLHRYPAPGISVLQAMGREDVRIRN